MATYQIVPSDGILRTTVEGDLDYRATAEVLHAIASQNAAEGHHLLVDFRGADGADLSFVDVYKLVKLLREHPTSFNGRIALLDSFREGFEKVQFFEASAEVEGYRVRSFLEEAAAVRWLEGQTL